MCGGHDVFESADLTNLGVVEPVHAFLWRVPVHKCSVLIGHQWSLATTGIEASNSGEDPDVCRL